MATGSIYRHFRSKVSLFSEMLRVVCGRELVVVQAIAAEDGRTAVERLGDAVTTFVDRALRGEGLVGGAGTWVRQAAIGAGTSGLNPKALLLFLALLPQFTTPSSAWPLAAQIMVLGLVFVTSCAIVYTAVAVGSRLILSARPSWARIVSRCSGAAMLTIGAVLLLHQIAA